tara:strand:- start:76 stop:927 length:852 start_codon:yes stop_codon:yes gene_type:complete
MIKYTILLPLYNDWESVDILIKKINSVTKSLSRSVEVIIINDNSINKQPDLGKFNNIEKITILNLKTNLGSQKAISIGFKYLIKREQEMIITVLDSDGEDDVNQIPIMVREAEKNKEHVIVSTRKKRQESFIFKTLYFLHKLITFIYTFKWISFGNYSSFHSKQLKNILRNDSSWLAISSCIAKNCKIKKIEAERKKRFVGESKISFFSLIKHSLRVNAVFISRCFILSFVYFSLFLLISMNFYKYFLVFALMVIFYFSLILLTFIFNKQKEFSNSSNFIKNY